MAGTVQETDSENEMTPVVIFEENTSETHSVVFGGRRIVHVLVARLDSTRNTLPQNSFKLYVRGNSEENARMEMIFDILSKQVNITGKTFSMSMFEPTSDRIGMGILCAYFSHTYKEQFTLYWNDRHYTLRKNSDVIINSFL